MEFCDNCIIPVGFPNYNFVKHDNQLLCNKCFDLMFAPIDRERLKKNWEKYLVELRKKEITEANKYHAILFYSGGRDSTASLYMLVKEFGLKILAFTLDNGMKGNSVLENIFNVTNYLGVDWYLIRHCLVDELNDMVNHGIYPCGKICNTLQDNYYKSITKKFNIETLVTGYEIAPKNKGIIEKDGYTIVSLPALLNFGREKITKICEYLPWKDFGYFDSESYVPGMTDCLAPCIAIEKKYGNHVMNFDNIQVGSIEYELLPYIADRVRFGAADRNRVLEVLTKPIKASELAWSEYSNCIKK
jgi:predicted PP-loop superfamily ATPase